MSGGARRLARFSAEGIGRGVIEIAKGFRLEVLATDMVPDEDLRSRLGFRYVEMDEPLASSDSITLQAPSNENPRHRIFSDAFARMQEGGA